MLRHVLVGSASASIIALVLVACSGDDGTASISPEAACDDFAKSYCGKVDQCAPLFVKLGFGDAATCEQRFKINCASSFSANGTSATPARASQCATEIKSLTCDDALGRKLSGSCIPEPGTLADGTACGNDTQCKGKLCRQSGASVCGACSTLGAAGAACERNEDCGPELGCAGKKCVAFGKAGTACSATQPCLGTLSCNKGTCAQPLAGGAACEPTLDQSQNPCDALKGFFCHGLTRVCTAVGTAAAGAPCGLIDNTFVLCTGGGHCKTPPGSPSGTCLAPAADGSACDDVNGPKCVAPARCVGGVCQISDPAACK